METKLQSKQQYPRFIQNKPCGIDKFDGGSQERLAKTIARHFWEQRRSSVAGLTEYPTDSVHEEWQVGDTVQLRTEPFEL